MINSIFKISALFLCLIYANTTLAQEKIQITKTNLSIMLPEGYVVDKNSAVLIHKEHSIVFMEMAGADYNEQIANFNTIEADYALKGIGVSKKIAGQLNTYQALFITLKTSPAIYQIFFGNANFCALANVTANDSTTQIDETQMQSILSTIEYKTSASPLEEHAVFKFKEEDSNWEFISYASNTFIFKGKEDDGVLVMQLPPETLQLHTKKDLAQQFITRYQSEITNMKVIKDEEWKVGDMEGHRVLLNLKDSENTHLNLIYIFIVQNPKSTVVVQGMGKSNVSEAIALFDKFLNNLELKSD